MPQRASAAVNVPQYWGRGLATGACIASLDSGFNTLRLDQIVVLVLAENAASIRVLEKAGMQSDGELVYHGTKLMHAWTVSLKGTWSSDALGDS